MSTGMSVLIIAVGAILRYAVTDKVSDVDLSTVGLILMIAGVAGLILSFFQEAIWSDRRRRRDALVEEREARPVAREEVPPREVREPPPRY